MCTAITYKTDNHYFGRNLDLEYSYDEKVTVTPRNYNFKFKNGKELKYHYAIIGMAYVVDNYPLYYDGTNEKGLSMAGLNFPDNAYYGEEKVDMDNITPFEFIPWILGQCADIEEVMERLKNINLVNVNFSAGLPLTPLHWIISDKEQSITVEPLAEGLKIYDNPVGVLTNNPPFDYHMYNLCNYMGLSIEPPINRFEKVMELKPYSRGMGAFGIPGDLSSASRFIRAAFTKVNFVSGADEVESVNQFLHILGAVRQQKGCVKIEDDKYEITVYSSCCNTDKGIYYYTTYENTQIMAVDMNKENLEGCELIGYRIYREPDIIFLNY